MSLKIVSGPSGEPVTLAEAKAHLRVTASDDDTYITTLIILARQEVERFTNRRLITQTWDWRLDAFPLWFLVPTPPLISVTSINYIDTDGNSQLLDSSIYDVDIFSAPARIMEAFGKSWTSTRTIINAVTVKFVCGYGDASDVPESLKQALFMILAHFYENREDTSPMAVHKIPKTSEHLMWNYRVRTQW